MTLTSKLKESISHDRAILIDIVDHVRSAALDLKKSLTSHTIKFTSTMEYHSWEEKAKAKIEVYSEVLDLIEQKLRS